MSMLTNCIMTNLDLLSLCILHIIGILLAFSDFQTYSEILLLPKFPLRSMSRSRSTRMSSSILNKMYIKSKNIFGKKTQLEGGTIMCEYVFSTKSKITIKVILFNQCKNVFIFYR